MDRFPLVIVHIRNYSLAVKEVVKQANQFDDFYFIGDRSISPTKNYLVDDLTSNKEKLFLESYVHRSPNKKWTARFCIRRYFLIFELMKKENLDRIFYIDSDVLLYTDPNQLDNYYDMTGWGGIKIDQNDPDHMWHINMGTSFFSYDILKEFTDFIVHSFSDHSYDKYDEKWQAYKENPVLGGISDMTVAYLFWEKHKDSFTNLVKIRNNTVFDHCLNMSFGYKRDQFEMENKMKKIRFRNNYPYGYDVKRKEWVKFHALHCHGVPANKIFELRTKKK